MDVTLNRKNRNLHVHLVNTAGPHDNDRIYVFDEVPAVGPLQVTIAMRQKPKSIKLQPSGQAMDFRYARGKAHVMIPRLEIYDILVVEE